MDTRIIRVFPTKTHATPEDEFVRIRETPSLFDEADEVHISVTFTWDKPWAEWAARQWERVAPVKIGGLYRAEDFETVQTPQGFRWRIRTPRECTT